MGGASGPGMVNNSVSTTPNNMHAAFNAFGQNAPPFQGNMWGSHNAHSTPGPRVQFERVTGKLPVDKFPYGTPEADWAQWCERFEKAVQVATNANGRDRLEELCLTWIPLKLNEEAQPIYDKCEHKNGSWPLLKAELADALEDPVIKRKWARHMDAYKKPASMSLQVYRANIIGFVNKHSPALLADPTAYNMELYNRFIHGLEKDWRDYIEESIPYKKESLDNAYSQALKYEDKLAKKSGDFNAAAMSHAEKDRVERIRRDLEKVKTQLTTKKAQENSSSSTSSGNGSNSDSDNYRSNDFRAIRTADEDSDVECKERLMKSATAAFTQAFSSSMKGLSLKPKGSKRRHRSQKQ